VSGKDIRVLSQPIKEPKRHGCPKRCQRISECFQRFRSPSPLESASQFMPNNKGISTKHQDKMAMETSNISNLIFTKA